MSDGVSDQCNANLRGKRLLRENLTYIFQNGRTFHNHSLRSTGYYNRRNGYMDLNSLVGLDGFAARSCVSPKTCGIFRVQNKFQ